ncbi:MAG: response regulator [Acidobacteriia bacterium]|nr:response regulator [Terriglobia bacterium]
MKRLNNLRLDSKIVGLVVLTNAATLTVLAVTFVMLEYRQAKSDLAQELLAVAETIGNNSTAALSFGDKRTAQENLESLKRDPRVVGAAIYLQGGTPIATYMPGPDSGQVERPLELALGATFEARSVLLVEDIRLNGERLGRIVLRASLDQFRERLWRYVSIGLLVLALSLVIGVVMSRRLAAIVIQPVLSLTEAARRLSTQADYEVCLSKSSNDEVGELTECFNGMLVAIRDRDRQLNDHREHLEDKVRRRTHDLEIAREKAEESARLKSEFLANMSHEIRTPLNGVMGMTSLALDTELPAEARDYLETANTSAENLLAVINDILDFSKIDAGKLVLESIPCEVPVVLGRLVKTFALTAHKKGLELVYDLDPALPPAVSVDPARLQQVLTNLINNAIKFTEAGTIVLAVQLRRIEDGCATLHFSVADTGIGIAKKHQATIFDSFSQADGSTTRKFGGTGLGLSIARRLVSLMGGSIALESEPGSGSTFHFDLRLPLVQQLPEVRTDAEQLRGLRVLIVDDHPVNRRVLAGYARRLGMEATDVGEAEQALRLAVEATQAGTPFQMVFTDFQMPGMDGLALVRAMREESCLTAIPILMLTSVDLAGFTERARECGVYHSLIKPVSPGELQDAALRALNGEHRSTNSQPEAKPEPERTRPLRVLVAEDNAVNQRLVLRLLEKLGHHAVVVGNGRLSLKAFGAAAAEGVCFDMILMDCQMPEMGGFEATRRIRRLERGTGSRIPIIALTAHALKGDRERCLEAGMDDYLSKPLDRKKFAAKLAEVAALRDRPARTSPDHSEPLQGLQHLQEATASKNLAGDLATSQDGKALKQATAREIFVPQQS